MKLSTVEKIVEIKDIEGADRIQAAKVLGYQSVIKKNEFAVGDLVVFIFPDSLLPRAKYNQFLWPKDDQDPSGEPVRLRACKFKKQISQGLIVSKNILPFSENYKEGDDVTEVLGITKYEKPIPAQLAGSIVGGFPTALFPKTDELNLCSYVNAVNDFVGKDCYISIKQDGSSLSSYFNNGHFGVCSRNLELQKDENNAFWKVIKAFNLPEKIKNFGFNAAVQGELIGPGVNGNKLNLPQLSFKAFNVFNIDTRQFLPYNEFIEICKKFEIPTVEIVWEGIFDKDLNWLIELAQKQEYCKGFPAEGIVIRDKSNGYSVHLDGRLSAKVINPIFAVKHGE